jgi:thymidylate synthase
MERISIIATENLSISGYHTPEVWMEGLKQLWYFGNLTEVVYDKKPVETVEVLGLRSQVFLPDKEAYPDGYIWKGGSHSWDDYRAGFLSPHNPGFEYTYGSRLRAWGAGYVLPPREVDLKPIALDQLDYIIRELRRDRSSRRAIAVTWVPPVDEETESPPCMMSFHAMIRGDRLSAFVPYRSHDWFGAYPANAYGLTGVMEYLAGELECGLGNLVCFSESAHIYWSDWPEVAALLGEKVKMPLCKQRKEQAVAMKKWKGYDEV